MTLYNAFNVNDIYKIIKTEYITKQYQNKKYNICQISSNDARLELLRKILHKQSSILDFSFVANYYDSCKYCYLIQNNNDCYFIIQEHKLRERERLQIFNAIHRISILKKLYNIQKPMNFYLVMYPKKRFMPRNNELFKAIHINGGFTYLNQNKVFVIRKEEFNKVLIHEFLHHNNVLQFERWSIQSIEKLKERFNIMKSFDLLPTEAIIEAYACLINAVFYAIEDKKKFMHLLKEDQMHSLKTAKKIIKFQKNKPWYEYTNVYCYTILKTIIYLNFNKFLKIFPNCSDIGIANFFIKYSNNMYKQIHDIKVKSNKLNLTIFN